MTLAPDFRLSAIVFIVSLPLLGISVWAAAPVALFAVFLAIQTALIRLTFSETGLEVYRGSTRIREFPYSDWIHWQIYSPPVPALFYFREVKSIHFIPMLFHPGHLQDCLQQHVPLGSLNSLEGILEGSESPDLSQAINTADSTPEQA